jgi:hypothetical protein
MRRIISGIWPESLYQATVNSLTTGYNEGESRSSLYAVLEDGSFFMFVILIVNASGSIPEAFIIF